jgi:hypothetical protein
MGLGVALLSGSIFMLVNLLVDLHLSGGRA